MEIFVDFGMFELVAALGISAVARRIYAHRTVGGLFLLASVVLPAVTIFMSANEEARWLAAGALVTALVNASVILAVLQRGEVPALTLPQRQKAKT
jgi:hypothetical protein